MRIKNILFIFLTFIIFLIYKDYGITFDEYLHKDYGNLVLIHLQSNFKNNLFLDYGNLYLYGAFADVFAQGIIYYFDLQNNLFEARHLINAVFGLVGFFYTYKLGKLLGSEITGIFSLILIFICPSFFGQIFNNPKDIPFASFYISSIYYILYYFKSPFPKRSFIIFPLGLSIGICLSIRIGAVLLIFFALIYFLLNIKTYSNIQKIKNFVYHLCILFFILILFIFIFFPYIKISPIKNFFEVLNSMSKFKWEGYVLFNGTYELATYLPWNYLPKYFLISIPEVFFLGFILFFYNFSKIRHKKEIIYFTFISFFPMIFVIFNNSTLYDGLRHFLFLFPLLAIISGYGLKFLYKKNNKLFYVLFLPLILLTIIDMIILHPYESVYYNRISGGLKKAENRFELDYWGNVHRELALWAKVNYDSQNKEVLYSNCVNAHISDYYLNQKFYIEADKKLQEIVSGKSKLNLDVQIEETKKIKEFTYPNQKYKYTKSVNDAELFFVMLRGDCFNLKKGKIIHTVKRFGVPLGHIIQKTND